MQNTNTTPQAFYTQPGNLQNNMPENQPKRKNSFKTKNILAVAGFVLFLVVAIMGVLIAQKQIARNGEDVTPVAPNAPESQPKASTAQPNNCVTLFYVPEIQPEVNCDSKTALTDFTSNNGKPIQPGSTFNVGDEFVFSILIKQPTDGVANDVQVVDVLSNSLAFVSAPTDPGYTITNNGQTVTATINEMGASSAVKVEFKVRVTANEPGKHTNSASVTSASTDNNSCDYDYITVKGKVECVDKKLYDLQGELIANGGSLTRGEEYEYRIRITATNKSLGEVKVHDVIPGELEYLRPAAGSEKYITNDPNSGILIANFGILDNEDRTLGFIVKVPSDIEIGKITNKALVYAFPKGSKQPEPPTNADVCEVVHEILPIGTAECVEKEAYTDFNGTEIAANTELTPGQEFVYKITLRAEETTSGTVTLVDKLPADLIFVQDSGNTEGIVYNSTSREVTLNFGALTAGQQKVVVFKVQLKANPEATTFTNIATVTTSNATNHTCELPLKVEQPVYECNSPCTEDTNCSEIGSDNHVCYQTGSGSFCRLESNPASTECKVASTPTPTPTPTATPTPTPAPGCNEVCTQNADCSNSSHICVTAADGSNRCRLAGNPTDINCEVANTPTPNPTGTPTPIATAAPGCNDLCTQNADCSNSSHVCLTTEDGSNRCRLAEYPTSNTCTEPSTYVAANPAQPELPTTLPQSGPADWLNWLKAGLVTLGLGTALFLLL